MVNDLLIQHFKDGNFKGLSAAFTVPLVTQNMTLTAQNKAQLRIYAQYQLMPLRNRMGTLADIEQSGLLQITLFTPLASGTAEMDKVARDIVDHFGTERSHMMNGYQVMIMSSTALAAMPDNEGKYMCPITIEYRIL